MLFYSSSPSPHHHLLCRSTCKQQVASMDEFMAGRATLKPQPELRSKTSADSNILTSDSHSHSITNSLSGFDEDDDPPSPTKSVFRLGVKRGLKKLGSFSRDSRRSPAPSEIEPFPARALDFSQIHSGQSSINPSQYDRRPSAQSTIRQTSAPLELEKPLPDPPKPEDDYPFQIQEDFRQYESEIDQGGHCLSSASEDTEEDEYDKDKDKEKCSTYLMESSNSPQHVGVMQQGAYGINGNRSQTSLAGSSRENLDSARNHASIQNSENGTPATAPQLSHPRSTGVHPVAAASPSQHLSGLMCNVHRTTGREPHSRVGATTTILGDKLFVFGGRVLSRSSPVLTSDLYELDLIRRHWTKIETSGPLPPARYFHSVCPLGDTKLVCYGGMSPVNNSPSESPQKSGPDTQPEVVVMSDIHIYDAPTKTWTNVPTAGKPQGRYAHCATILPSSAVFTSTNAPLSALQHNSSSTSSNQGSLGINIDGAGGAELVVVGGQDSANHYIEQISVFNFRSLRWTSTTSLGKSCGAYRSVVAPIPAHLAPRVGSNISGSAEGLASTDSTDAASSMLIYSNYNFLDVKLELQMRSSDGTLTEKPMQGTFTPPGLRFPNGGVIGSNFVVSGTYLTSSKQEYALWALDLETLSWSRIDAGGAVFSQGSWNRGILWNRRNTFVILGNRKRSLVEDYNHRRLNFSNICMVELEAFGLYDNPRTTSPMSGYVSASSEPNGLTSPNPSAPSVGSWLAGGRTISRAAEDLGNFALSLREFSDMDILAVGGERIPVNSRVLSRRWGPYFIQLLREGAGSHASNMDNQAVQTRYFVGHQTITQRNSSVTITPSLDISLGSNFSRQTTLNDELHCSGSSYTDATTANSLPATDELLSHPTASLLSIINRPRTLYLPHTYLTIRSLLHFLYTSSLAPQTSTLSTPQILCSLLQLARPYQIDGLAEAVIERLHIILDSRNAAAVFNATAMAAGGGRGITGPQGRLSGSYASHPNNFVDLKKSRSRSNTTSTQATIDSLDNERESAYTTNRSTSATNSVTPGDHESQADSTRSTSRLSGNVNDDGGLRGDKSVWDGDFSCVIGLQKRGLRGLMEGRRLRERGASLGHVPFGSGGQQQQVTNIGLTRIGLGIGSH